MNDSQKFLNGIAGKGGGIKRNTPPQYGDRQHRYYRDRNAYFVDERAEYAADYFLAEAQGLNAEDIYEWTPVYIRFADVTSRVDSQAMKTDDFKQVLFKDTWIDYIPLGSKIRVAGSVWLVTNPANISAVNAKTVVTRCNTAYNYYDEYGIVDFEPVFVENAKMLSNESNTPENVTLMAGYFKITAQLNEETAKIRLNQRIILGRQPYFITGVQDFLQEFTGDRESVRLVTFTARIEEPTELDDIDTDFVAGGKARTFVADLKGNPAVTVGAPSQFSVRYLRDGEVFEPTEEYPVDWVWSTSNGAVASVDGNGLVRGISAGKALLIVTMAQNEKITSSVELTVIGGSSAHTVAFKTAVTDPLKQYGTLTLNAAYYTNQTETDVPLVWSFSGAKPRDYDYEIAADGKSVTITCLSPSDVPLEVTASYGSYKAVQNVVLEGY